MGMINYGQNGDGDNNFKGLDDNGFHQIPFFEDKIIKHIAAGYEYSLFVDSDDCLWYCGRKSFKNQEIISSTTESMLPIPIIYFRNKRTRIKQISCGVAHNLILGDTGICYAFGYNEYGQCGTGDLSLGAAIFAPTPIKTSKSLGIVYVECGYFHSYVKYESRLQLSSAKTIQDVEHYLFGRNDHNQCTLITEENIIKCPHPITAPFAILTNNRKSIVRIHLGCDSTWIYTLFK